LKVLAVDLDAVEVGGVNFGWLPSFCFEVRGVPAGLNEARVLRFAIVYLGL